MNIYKISNFRHIFASSHHIRNILLFKSSGYDSVKSVMVNEKKKKMDVSPFLLLFFFIGVFPIETKRFPRGLSI